MNSSDTGNYTSLARICVDGVCHCDWRLTIKDCAEANALTVINYINIVLSGIVVVIGVTMLIYRIFVKGHRFVEINLSKGCFRPKPVDCMLLCVVIYSSLRAFSSIVLITDIFPDMITRSFLFEIPWQFGVASFSVYLVGIAQTLADSNRLIASKWLSSARLVDIIGTVVLFAPFITNNIMSLAAGFVAERDVALADTFTRLIYILWFIYCFFLSSTVLFAGNRLVKILKNHARSFEETGPRLTTIENSIFRIRVTINILFFCLTIYPIYLLMYGILRKTIMVNTKGSIFLGLFWNLLAVTTMICVEATLLLNPRLVEKKLGLSLIVSSTGGSESLNRNSSQLPVSMKLSTKEYSYKNASFNEVSPEILSYKAFDDVKLQQIQYQKVVHKQQSHQYPIDKQILGADLPESTETTTRISLQNADPHSFISHENHTFQSKHDQSYHHDEDTVIVDDGETSQNDLIVYAPKK